MRDTGLSTAGRAVLVTVVVVTLLAGCPTNDYYSTSVSEPTNGTVIQGVTVYDVNEIDGARYELSYQRTGGSDSTLALNTYERRNGSDELLATVTLAGPAPTYENDLTPPWDPGEERVYRLEVVREESDDVVDAITITITREK